MSDLQAIADRVQIEALRGEATDAAMMRVYEVRYLDHSPLAGSAPRQEALANPPATGIAASQDRSSRAVMEEEVT
jgi:hypothetical protein